MASQDPASSQLQTSANEAVPSWEDFQNLRGRRFLLTAGHFDFFSGAEKQAVYFARELVRHLDVDVRFIGWGGDGRFADEIRNVGAVPVPYQLSVEDTFGWAGYRLLLPLAAFIRDQLKPDFLLPYVWMHCRIIGAIWRRTGASFCWWNQRDEGRGITGTWLERRLMKSLPAVISNSWEGRDFLTQKFRLSESRVQVINNGVLVTEAGQNPLWRQQHAIPENALLISMVATLSKFKDHPVLLKAFAAAANECPEQNLQLVLAGDHADMTDTIRSLAVELGITDRLHLPGAITNVNELLRSVDLVVHSSNTEGCPNGVLEPMALGIPVVGTDISGIRQALGDSSLEPRLNSPGNWRQLSEMIVRRVKSPELRAEEGALNRKRIQQHFSIDLMARKSLAVIWRWMQTQSR